MVMPTHIVAAGGIVENDQSDILLVKTVHGGWVFPGGQVEVGENVTDALLREIEEESGVDVEVCHLLGVYSNTGVHKFYDGVTDVPTKLMLDFACVYKEGELRTSDETPEVAWVAKEEVLHFIQAPAIRKRFEAYLQFDGKIRYMDYVTHPAFKLKRDRYI